MLGSTNMVGWVSPGFTKTSNDNARPTADVVFPLGADWDEVSFDVFDVVCEAVVAGAFVFVSGLVAFASVGAVDDGAELAGVGALNPSVVVGLLCTELVVGAIAGEDGVVRTLVGFAGLTGDTGLVTFVDLLS